MSRRRARPPGASSAEGGSERVWPLHVLRWRARRRSRGSVSTAPSFTSRVPMRSPHTPPAPPGCSAPRRSSALHTRPPLLPSQVNRPRVPRHRSVVKHLTASLMPQVGVHTLSGHPQKSISRVSGAQVCRVGGPAWTRFEHRGARSGERDRDRRPGLNRRDRGFRCVTRQTPLPVPKKPDAKLQGDRRAAAWPGSTGHLLRTARLPECTPGPGGGVGGRPSDGAPVLWLGLNRDARTGGSRGPRFPRQTSLVTTRVPPGGPRTRWATGSTDALSLCPCDGGAPPPTLWGAKAISWGQRGTGSKAGNPVQGHIQVPLTTQLAKSPDLSWPVS